MIRAGIVAVLASLLLSVAAGAQIAADGSSIELGMSFGLMWLEDIEPMSTVGGVVGISMTPELAIRASYWHAGISFLGISLLSVDAFDLTLVVNLSAGLRYSFYAMGGAGFLLAGALGESISGFLASAGLGLRVSPIDMLSVFVEYKPLIRNGVIHVIQAGISLAF